MYDSTSLSALALLAQRYRYQARRYTFKLLMGTCPNCESQDSRGPSRESRAPNFLISFGDGSLNSKPAYSPAIVGTGALLWVKTCLGCGDGEAYE